MSMHDPTDRPAPDGPDAAALEADIELARDDLAHTVDQLASKLDVKARVQDRLTDDEGEPTPAALGLGGGLAAAVVVLVAVLLWRHHRASRWPKR